MLALGIICAIGASALYNTSIALQALEARDVGHEHALRVSLIGRLIKNPRWLLATGIGLLGWPLEIAALLLAPLTVVQPCLACGLVLLLWLGVTRLGEKPGPARVRRGRGDPGRGRGTRLGGARTDHQRRRGGADRDRAGAGDDPGRRPLCRARAAERRGDAGRRRRGLRLRLDGDRLEAPHRRTLGGLAPRRRDLARHRRRLRGPRPAQRDERPRPTPGDPGRAGDVRGPGRRPGDPGAADLRESWSDTPGGGAGIVASVLLVLAGVVALAGSKAVGAVIDSAHAED